MSESEKKETAAPREENASELTSEEFAKAVNEGKEDSYKKVFDILKKKKTTAVVPPEHIAAIGGSKLESEAIHQLTKHGPFNYDEFLDIIKLLKEPGEKDQMIKIGEKLLKAEERKEIIVYGEEGVGKTWMAREVAALAVRKRHFDVAIWLYLDRTYEDFSLRKSIAYQLHVLAELEEYEAEEAKKKKADGAKKKDKPREEEKGEIKDETDHRKEKMDSLIKKADSLIKKALEGKKLLLIMDGQGSKMEAKVTTKEKEKKEKNSGDQKEKEKSSGDQKEKEKSSGDQKEKERSSGDQKEKEKSSSDRESDGKKVEEKTQEGEGENKVDHKKEKEILVLELMVTGVRKVSLELGCLESYKSLITITRKEVDEGDGDDDRIMVKPFTWKAAKSLASGVLMETETEKNEEVEELVDYFMLRSKRLPAQLLLISRIVSYFSKPKSRLKKLRKDRELLKKGDGGAQVLDVLIKGYERIPKSVLIDRYSTETPKGHFLHRGSEVNYNELIWYWIMEGHLGHFDRVEKAYAEGHRVLMELMNCGLLQRQEADNVVATTTKFNLDIHEYKDFFRGVRPGLAVTFDMKLGKVAVADGMIKTVESFSHDEKKEIISALLLDNNRIREAEPLLAQTLTDYENPVQVLAITDPTSQHLKLPILEIQKLRLLALRGCQFLDSFDPFFAHLHQKLESLTVIEISGPCTSLESIPDHLFGLVPNLKTLNLSYLVNIKKLPSPFYNLTQIEFLILRGCQSLTELGTLRNFKDLKVLDVSEATNFEKFEDKSLNSNKKLQVLNLSKTNLKTLPLINQLEELKYVWLSDCAVLPRIRKIDRLLNLQILDISGAAQVERFCDPSLEDLKSLVIIDISRTAIKRLPANIGDPKYLYVKDCHKLKVVPPVEGLSKLQVVHLSGCHRLTEVRKEFFANVKGLIELDLSRTSVEDLPFLDSLLSLRTLLLSECVRLKKLDKLSCLKELKSLDLSGCEKLEELEDGSFDKMIHLKYLYLSGTGLGGREKPLPSLSNLKNLKQLFVRDCPNLTNLPGVEELLNLKVLDCTGTVLESPPSFSDGAKPPLRVDGAGIESINISQLMKRLGASQQSVDGGAKWDPTFKYKEVSECKWNISNWPIEAAQDEDKPGMPVYGVHFLRLLKVYPSFLTDNLSTFRFLVYPFEAKFPSKDFWGSYIDELSLREIYLEQICKEKMERCLEIREFNKLPESLRPLIAQAEFIVLLDDPFLTSLIDLGVDDSMAMKACWIERCNGLKHVVAKIDVEKSEEATKGKGEERKNVAAAGELGKGEDDQHKNIAAEKLAQSKGDQQKINVAAEEKSGESAKSEGEQPKNVAAAGEEKTGESAKKEGEQPKNAAEEKTGEAANSEGDQQKNVAAAEKSGEPTKSEGDQPKNVGEAKTGESAKSEGDRPKNAAAAEKSGEPTKSEGDQPKNAGEAKTGESAKSEGDQPKNAAVAEKSGEPTKSEGDQPKNAAAAEEKSRESVEKEGEQPKNAAVGEEKIGESAKSEGDQPKNVVVAEKSGEPTKSEGDQPKNVAAAEEKSRESVEKEGEQPKNAAVGEEKIGESAKSEGDQPKNAVVAEKSGEPTKSEGDQPKNVAAAEEKSRESVEKEGEQPKNAAVGEEKIGESAKSEGDQPENAAEEKSGEPTKSEGDQPKNPAAEEKSGEPTKSEGDSAVDSSSCDQQKNVAAPEKSSGDQPKNPAEDLKKLETLWISDVLNLKSICEGNIQSVSFKFLKSLYLEYCPQLSVICSSSMQLETLETLYIKYCQKLEVLFTDDNPSEMKKLRVLQLWGLDSLKKIGCNAPSLRKLRVGQCRLLEHVIASRLAKAVEQMYENEGHENLEILHIKSCDKLKSIFESSDDVDFDRLTELELLGLPKLRKVARAAPALRVLKVGDCPSLETIIVTPNFEEAQLATCEIWACPKIIKNNA